MRFAQSARTSRASSGRALSSGSDAQLLGVREIRLQVNAGPRLLAHQGYQGYGYVETPESLADKCCVINIKNTDHRCIQYCLVAYNMWQKGKLPKKDAQEAYHYQRVIPGTKRKREEVPIPCDYDLSAFETTEDIAEQLVKFEEANPYVGV